MALLNGAGEKASLSRTAISRCQNGFLVQC